MNPKKFALCVLAILVVEMAGSLSGELRLPGVIKTKVPFAFQVGNTDLPGGEYTLRNWGGDGQLVLLQGPQARAKLFAAEEGSAAAAPQGARLVFHRYGDRYFLSELWFQGESTGRKLPIPTRERQLLAMSQPAAVVVPAGR